MAVEAEQRKIRAGPSPSPSSYSDAEKSPGPGPGPRVSLLMTGNGHGPGNGQGSGHGQMQGQGRSSNTMMSSPTGGDRDASPSRPYLPPLHDPPLPATGDSSIHSNDASSSANPSTSTSSGAGPRSLVHTVNTHVAAWYMSSSRPLLAAAQHLSVGDVHACLRTLSLCGEHDLAYAVAVCTGADPDPHLIRVADALAKFAARNTNNLAAASAASAATTSASPVQPSSTGLFTALGLLNQLTGSIYKGSSVSPATAVAALFKKTPKKTTDSGSQEPQELTRSQLALYIQEEKGLLLVRYTDKEGTSTRSLPIFYLSSSSNTSSSSPLSLPPSLSSLPHSHSHLLPSLLFFQHHSFCGTLSRPPDPLGHQGRGVLAGAGQGGRSHRQRR